MLKNVLLAGAASLFVVSAAQAADIVAPEAYDWTGPYVGLQGGYAWGENDVSSTGTESTEEVLGRAAVLNGRDGHMDLDGFVGGLHAGYNWQSDALVLGIEGDIEFADINGDTDVINGNGIKVGEVEQEIDWLGSLRLRAGFAADRALFYATGGLAVGGVELTLKDSDGDEFASNSETNWGWTLGGGIEYAVTDDLSARIEYRYTDLGDIDADNGDDDDGKADTAFHAVRAGLSWHF
ncbi:outer membrane protein [Aestuariivirga sp. YIM B02566]|uniref:Porin family protein n=1 Tax=Taklimakanibacter albus TaxID=2800327 RepID=A0ACC5R6L3_9HYPH|nr:outer membrane protein [Aestuariivirga sp. YIM B02566]MBK1868301.1 porin family protein [Aestuariivirga sp. YIM B02566]